VPELVLQSPEELVLPLALLRQQLLKQLWQLLLLPRNFLVL
jgi:hypothetical protein